MTERQRNKEYIKNKLKHYNLDNKCIDTIISLMSENYTNGLNQGYFDCIMDMNILKEENDRFKINLVKYMNLCNKKELDIIKLKKVKHET